jgi:hypothetical protein
MPVSGLVVVAEMHQREQRESGITQPAIAVIPVSNSADEFRQGRGRCSDDPSAWSIGQRFQRDQRALDRIRPRTNFWAAVAPIAPELFGSVKRVERIDHGRRIPERESIRENERLRLALFNRECSDRLQVFSFQGDLRPEHQPLGTGDRTQSAVIKPRHPRDGRTVVEAHDEFGAELDSPPQPGDDPDEMGAIAWDHEISDDGAAVRAPEYGIENDCTWPVTALGLDNRLPRPDKPPPVLAVSEESRKARGRIKSRPA